MSGAARENLTRFAWLSIAAALATIALKTTAWWLTGSVGLLSDAIESVVNLVAAIVALVALTIAAKPADDNHQFGHTKVEYFSAMVESGMIFVAAVAIIAAAGERLLNPAEIESVGVGLAVSVVASVLNGLVAMVLLRAGREHRSITLTADGKHLLTDVWTSVGVVVGVALVAITGWEPLDPLIAIAVGLNILITGWKLMSQAVDGLMDHVAPAESRQKITEVLDRYASDEAFFHLVRLRESGHITFFTCHVTLPERWTVEQADKWLLPLEHDLQEAIPHCDVTIRVESKGLPCSADKHAPALAEGTGTVSLRSKTDDV